MKTTTTQDALERIAKLKARLASTGDEPALVGALCDAYNALDLLTSSQWKIEGAKGVIRWQ